MVRPRRIQPDTTDPDSISTPEVCQLLGVSRATLFRYLQDPAYSSMPRPMERKQGAPLRWPREAVIAWARSKGFTRDVGPDPG